MKAALISSISGVNLIAGTVFFIVFSFFSGLLLFPDF